MTRSIFDPTGDETERGRSQFLGPSPTEHSTLPPAAVDGKVESLEDVVVADDDDIADLNPDRDDVT